MKMNNEEKKKLIIRYVVAVILLVVTILVLKGMYQDAEERKKELMAQNEMDGLMFKMKDDPRITKVGKFIRKTSIDELPQFWNVLKGDMSLVGPRPEVRKYVELYTEEQRKVLSVRPGITDYASIEYVDENTILGQADDADEAYVTLIMPDKIRYNMKYINNRSLKEYFKIIFLTFWRILR